MPFKILVFNDGDAVPEWLLKIEAKKTQAATPHMTFQGQTIVIDSGSRYVIIGETTDTAPIYVDGNGGRYNISAASKRVCIAAGYMVMHADDEPGGGPIRISENRGKG